MSAAVRPRVTTQFPITMDDPDTIPLSTGYLHSFGRQHSDSLLPAYDQVRKHPVQRQIQSPLFAKFPAEVRLLIYKAALSPYEVPLDSFPRRGKDQVYYSRKCRTKPKVDTNLLLTCRAVYLEAWKLALILNPIRGFHLEGMEQSRPTPHSTCDAAKYGAWQFAHIQRLELSIRQSDLEEWNLLEAYSKWLLARDRHQSVRIVKNPFAAHSRSNIATWSGYSTSAADLSRFRTMQHGNILSNEMDPLVARPITSLTIRIGRTDWWTWTEPPNSTSRMGLDPSLHFDSMWAKNNASVGMQILFKKRMSGDTLIIWEDPSLLMSSNRPYGRPWGNQLSAFPDLEELVLELETFAAKKDQLEDVVNCAREWKLSVDLTSRGREQLEFESVEARSIQPFDHEIYGYETKIPWLLGPPEQRTSVLQEVQKIQASEISGAHFEPSRKTLDALHAANKFEVRTVRFTKRTDKDARMRFINGELSTAFANL